MAAMVLPASILLAIGVFGGIAICAFIIGVCTLIMNRREL